MKIKLLLLALFALISASPEAEAAGINPFHSHTRHYSSVHGLNKKTTELPTKSKFYTWNSMDQTWAFENNMVLTYTNNGELETVIAFAPDGVTKESKKVNLFDSRGKSVGSENYTWNGTEWEMQNGYKDVNIYNSKGQIDSVKYYYYDQPTSTWLSDGQEINSYDQNGNLTSTVDQLLAGGSFRNAYRYSFTYDNNKISEMLYEEWNGTGWDPSERYTNIVMHRGSGLEGEPQSYVTQEWDNGAWVNEERYNAVYDSNGGYVGTYQDWDTDDFTDAYRTTIGMDSHGRQTESKDEYIDNGGWVIDYWTKYANTYDNDRLTQTITLNWDEDKQVLGNQYKEEFSDFTVVASIKYNKISSLNIYPNPASDIVNISNTDNAKVISVADINGRIVLAQNVSGQNISLDVSALQKGVYILQLSGNNGIQVSRLIKQ
jgi:hypothetical protein